MYSNRIFIYSKLQIDTLKAKILIIYKQKNHSLIKHLFRTYQLKNLNCFYFYILDRRLKAIKAVNLYLIR